MKGNRKLVFYSQTVEARRVKLVRHAGGKQLLDVGAIVGQWATEARRAGWDGPIWSFEPVSAAFKKLNALAAADPLWHVQQVAVGDQSGSRTINVSHDTAYSSLALMLDAGTDANARAAYVQTEPVTVCTLDQLAENI